MAVAKLVNGQKTTPLSVNHPPQGERDLIPK